MIIEMRTYKIKPSQRTEFLKILGPFLSVEDADTFFWMRAFGI